VVLANKNNRGEKYWNKEFLRSMCSTLLQQKTSLDLQNIPYSYDIPEKIYMTTTL
jgi:hypothetical protein